MGSTPVQLLRETQHPHHQGTGAVAQTFQGLPQAQPPGETHFPHDQQFGGTQQSQATARYDPQRLRTTYYPQHQITRANPVQSSHQTRPVEANRGWTQAQHFPTRRPTARFSPYSQRVPDQGRPFVNPVRDHLRQSQYQDQSGFRNPRELHNSLSGPSSVQHSLYSSNADTANG